MMRSVEEMEKIAKALRELVVTSMQSINEATNLSPLESNAIVVGVIQHVYAELCASLIAGTKPEKRESVLKMLAESFERHLEKALERESKMREVASKLAGMSNQELADKIGKEYGLDDLEDADGDDGKDPKKFN